jgi:cell division protein FtsB
METKSQMINRIAELSQENAELKDENVKLKTEMTELEEKFLTLNGKSYSYYTTLQEIKTIAERAFAVCDDDCGNANKFKEIIELTKEEEELDEE